MRKTGIPRTIGKYTVQEVLGEGGMGTVYKGFDPYNNRMVALKLASDTIWGDDGGKRLRDFFFNEARIAGGLDHPNILKIYDAGIDGSCYVVSEYVEGCRTLKDFCAEGALLPIETVVEIIFRCCKALDYAHKQNVIHRDIKPSNILLTGEFEVKIGDFGIAKINRSDDTKTQIGGLVGSPCYMSPEQIREEELSWQTDLFSLGIVFYELLTGRSPFHAPHFEGVMRNILFKDPPPVRFYRSDVSRFLDAVVMKALKKKQVMRYRTAAELASDLMRASTGVSKIEEDISDKERFLLLRKLDCFADFTDAEVWEVMKDAVWRQSAPGEDITGDGLSGDRFYVIVQGEVAMRKVDRTVGTLAGGDCFGIIGYLTKKRSSVGLVSINQATVIELDQMLIEQTSLSCQLRFHKMFFQRLIERLSRSEGEEGGDGEAEK